ncbi:Extended synaptotagmin-2 [Toxocara canis]|uniref:Extended synaptotagmin-2 n=1 Tax=Toxocara canis TaxID=6265 RepID=A0A0B2VBN4_TOXCA|nr:Extended synaptotagmin-2 [Toxocara canis]
MQGSTVLELMKPPGRQKDTRTLALKHRDDVNITRFVDRGRARGGSSPAEEEMAWQSYVVPISGGLTLMGACYYLGHNNYSFFWILLLVLLNVIKSYMWRRREKRLIALRQTAVKEREVIMAQLQDLPAWVQFPDTERVEWINKVIHQLWPYIGEYAKQFMREFVEPQVKSQMPAPFKSFKFTKMDMGDIPCRVGGIKVYTHNVGRDRIIVDMDVAYAGDSDFSVTVAGFTGGLNQLQFSGKLRAVLKPLLPFPPMVGGVSGYFLEMPKIDFNLTGMGEMVELPGLMNAIRTIVNAQVSSICVLPNEIVVPLAPNVDVTKLYFPEPDGVIRLKIIEAKNLENRDITFLKKGKSDPYVEIQVGSQFFKTRTIDNDLNPVWNEYFEAVVDEADGQKLRLELFDEDTTGSDEELGRLSLDLDIIKRDGSVDRWFPLEGCKHGDIHIKASWLNLSKSVKDLERQDWETEWLRSDKPIHPALLMIFVDNVSDLPYPKAKLEPSPFVEVRLGQEVQKTPVKVKTVNPLFQNKFAFFVRHPEGQELVVEAIDDGTRRSLGDMTLPLKTLLSEPNLEFFQQTFSLTQGVHQSPIVLTIRLRTFRAANRDESPLSDEQGAENILRESAYANAVHIERAERPTTLEMRNGASGVNNNITKQPLKANLSSGDHSNRHSSLTAREVQLLRKNSADSISSSQSFRRRGFGDKLFSSKHKRRRSHDGGSRGQLQMTLRYTQQTNKLIVIVHRAKGLRPLDKNGSADPYVSVKLVCIDGSQPAQKKRTGVVERCLDPQYDNHFEFDVHSSDLHHYKLQLIVKDAINYGIFAKPPVIGMVELRLENFDLSHELTDHWVELDPVSK